MHTVTVTVKRQATLPVALCKELGIAPGHKLALERRVVEGRTVWVLLGRTLDWSWFGAARRYGRRKSHRWSDVKRSITREWAGDARP